METETLVSFGACWSFLLSPEPESSGGDAFDRLENLRRLTGTSTGLDGNRVQMETGTNNKV